MALDSRSISQLLRLMYRSKDASLWALTDILRSLSESYETSKVSGIGWQELSGIDRARIGNYLLSLSKTNHRLKDHETDELLAKEISQSDDTEFFDQITRLENALSSLFSNFWPFDPFSFDFPQSFVDTWVAARPVIALRMPTTKPIRPKPNPTKPPAAPEK